MDGSRFDRLTRGLAPGASRRGLLGGAAGGAAALASSRLGTAKQGGATCAACLPVNGTLGTVRKSKRKGWYTATGTGPGDEFAVDFAVPPGTRFAEIASMRASFALDADGHCPGQFWFGVALQNGRCPYASIPRQQCNMSGATFDTGELVRNQTARIWYGDYCHGSNLTGYADVLAANADATITYVQLYGSISTAMTISFKPCVRLD